MQRNVAEPEARAGLQPLPRRVPAGHTSPRHGHYVHVDCVRPVEDHAQRGARQRGAAAQRAQLLTQHRHRR